MKNLYIDFDGVIMDTIPAIYQYLKDNGFDLKDQNPSNDQFEKITNLIAVYDFNKLLLETKEINNAFANIKKIIDSNKFNVSILSHINSLEEGIAKVELLESKLSGISIILVPKKLSKTKMVNSNDAILIDDYDGNLKEWEAAGGKGILFSQTLKDKGYPVIDHLNQVIDLC